MASHTRTTIWNRRLEVQKITRGCDQYMFSILPSRYKVVMILISLILSSNCFLPITKNGFLTGSSALGFLTSLAPYFCMPSTKNFWACAWPAIFARFSSIYSRVSFRRNLLDGMDGFTIGPRWQLHSSYWTSRKLREPIYVWLSCFALYLLQL